MHRKTNLLVTSTRSSVCCANLTLGFSVNFVHKKHLTERYQWTATNKLKKWPRSNFHLENPIQIIPHFLRMTGLEPARRKHQNLNLARLPIPPHPHIHTVNSLPASTLIMIRDILILVKHLFLTDPFYCKTKNRNTSTKGFRLSFTVKHRGFEPRTTWLKVKCSTNWANIPYKRLG